MSRLYPTLEDMKVNQYMEAQMSMENSSQNNFPQMSPHSISSGSEVMNLSLAYPSLMDEYMGLKLDPPSRSPGAVSDGEVSLQPTLTTGTVHLKSTGGTIIAPLTYDDPGLKRANLNQCIREVICCKNENGKFGMRFRDVNKGLFIQFVENGSPAALAGLRFGDQVLQINGTNVAGFSCDQAFKHLSKITTAQVSFIVRDRPFERTITLHKDSRGFLGFTQENGLIKAIVKDSSAARNGLLIEQNILEINGQNVVGLKTKALLEILEKAGQIVTLTIMPKTIYEHMVQCMSDGLMKKFMDRSIPDVL